MRGDTVGHVGVVVYDDVFAVVGCWCMCALLCFGLRCEGVGTCVRCMIDVVVVVIGYVVVVVDGFVNLVIYCVIAVATVYDVVVCIVVGVGDVACTFDDGVGVDIVCVVN